MNLTQWIKPGTLLREALLLADRLAPGAGVPVLCYHKICDADRASRQPLALSRDRFEAQMEYLASTGYQTLNAGDALAPVSRGRRLVALTFDDGHADALELAAPILARLGFTATVFPVTDWIGTQGWMDHNNGNRLEAPRSETDLPTRFLSWDELRCLLGQGWSVGAHTRSHPPMLDLSPAERRHEMADSKWRLERELGIPVDLFAYPFRSYGPETVNEARLVGFRVAFAPEPGLNHPGVDAMAARRAGIRGWHDLGDLRLRLTGKYALFQRLVATLTGSGGRNGSEAASGAGRPLEGTC